MKWLLSRERRRLEDEWARLRAGIHRRGPHRRPRRRSPLASAEDMRKGRWKMNYERDENGRLM